MLHRQDLGVGVSGNEPDFRFGLQLLQQVDEIVERLRVAKRGNHVAGEENRIEPLVPQRIAETALVLSKFNAFQIRKVKNGVAVQICGKRSERHTDAEDVYKTVRNSVPDQEGGKKKKQRPQKERCRFLFWLLVTGSKLFRRCGAKTLPMPGWMAVTGLAGASVHGGVLLFWSVSGHYIARESVFQ